MKDTFFIFVSAAIVTNFVLVYFLGLCPVIGVTNKSVTGVRLGLATTFVMVLASFAALLVCYCGAVWLGYLLAGRPGRLGQNLRSDVVAIVPIALGYHFAHYLTAFLVDVQYAAITFSDPFGRGWDLFGLGHAHVTTSFLTNFDSVRLIWHTQILSIVIAHVVAVAIAHLIAIRRIGRRRTAMVGQLPMTALMIGYTLFGLWLLSAPAIG